MPIDKYEALPRPQPVGAPLEGYYRKLAQRPWILSYTLR